MAFYSIRMRWTEFIWENQSSARFREPFLVPLVCWGVSCPFVSLYSLFIVDIFLLNGVPRVGACPIRPSLQYGHVRHKAMNAIMTSFSLDTSLFSVCPFLLQYFSFSVVRYRVSLPVAGYLLYPQLNPCRGGFSSWPRRGLSLGWALAQM